VTPTRHTGSPREAERGRSPWPVHGPVCAATRLPAQCDGPATPMRWIACLAPCRRYRSTPRPGHVRPPTAARSGNLRAQSGEGGIGRTRLGIRSPETSAPSCSGCRLCRPRTARQRLDMHGQAARHDRADPRQVPVRTETRLACLIANRWLVSLGLWTIRRCSRSARRRQGRGPWHRSDGGQQCLQPFKLADYLAEAVHARAVGRLQTHGRGEVATPGHPVPVRMLGGCVCARARAQGCRLSGGDHLDFEFGQTRATEGDLQGQQHLAAERVW